MKAGHPISILIRCGYIWSGWFRWYYSV